MGGEEHERRHELGLPQLRLDELLEELQVRLDAARNTRDRVHNLLEAVLTVGRELDLVSALRSIVEAAVVLVDAEYGALGVIGPDGTDLSQFLTVGVTEEQTEAIGPLPSGHGILGELIRHPHPLRLRELGAHPASYGFPANHPPMRSFLGVPIRVRDQVFGNLYLTQKRGAAEFDAEDEAVLATLAVAAGVAIDNARLYEDSVRRQRWLAAAAEVTSQLLSGGPPSEVLRLIAERARETTVADLAVVAIPHAEGELVVELALGCNSEDFKQLTVPIEGTLMGTAFAGSSPVVSKDLASDPRLTRGGRLDRCTLGPAVAVPIGTGTKGVRGVLLLARGAGAPVFTDSETEPLLGFAGQAVLAMELAERRRDAEQIALLEDRDRIARDLHDLAIQRLFATGMTLQSAERFIEHPCATERVTRAVEDLDETIKIIRSAIFGLRSHEGGVGEVGQSLRARVARAVAEAVPVLGFAPRLRMEGLLDTDVRIEVADHIVAVLIEALANVSRHARAGWLDVSLGIETGEVVLRVTDNGIGIPAVLPRRGGLRNLTERAEQVGGKFTADPAEGGGTCLVWRAPTDG